MANPGVIKNYNADGAVGHFLIVSPGGAASEVKVAAAATDALLGVSTFVDSDDGEPCDVVHNGIADVFAGGSVAAGDLLTSDGSGKAVKATPTPGTNARTVGIALKAGAAGDVIQALLNLSSVQG